MTEEGQRMFLCAQILFASSSLSYFICKKNNLYRISVCLSGRVLWTGVQCLYHHRQSVSARPHTAHMLTSAVKKLYIPFQKSPRCV